MFNMITTHTEHILIGEKKSMDEPFNIILFRHLFGKEKKMEEGGAKVRKIKKLKKKSKFYCFPKILWELWDSRLYYRFSKLSILIKIFEISFENN